MPDKFHMAGYKMKFYVTLRAKRVNVPWDDSEFYDSELLRPVYRRDVSTLVVCKRRPIRKLEGATGACNAMSCTDYLYPLRSASVSE